MLRENYWIFPNTNHKDCFSMEEFDAYQFFKYLLEHRIKTRSKSKNQMYLN